MSEQIRFYNDDLEIVPDVPIASGERKGELRSPTIRDARKWGHLPSVTSLTKFNTSWSLIEWLKKNIAATAANFPYDGDPEDEEAVASYQGMLLAKADEYRDEAAAAGTEIHKVVEIGLVTGEVPENPIHARILDEIKTWLENEKMTEIDCEKTLGSKAHGFAGTPDISATDGTRSMILDLKTRDSVEKMKWNRDDWKLQLAAYLILSNGEAECWQVVACRNTGACVFKQYEDIDHWADCFKAIVNAWCLIRKHDPRKEQ